MNQYVLQQIWNIEHTTLMTHRHLSQTISFWSSCLNGFHPRLCCGNCWWWQQNVIYIYMPTSTGLLHYFAVQPYQCKNGASLHCPTQFEANPTNNRTAEVIDQYRFYPISHTDFNPHLPHYSTWTVIQSYKNPYMWWGLRIEARWR